MALMLHFLKLQWHFLALCMAFFDSYQLATLLRTISVFPSLWENAKRERIFVSKERICSFWLSALALVVLNCQAPANRTCSTVATPALRLSVTRWTAAQVCTAAAAGHAGTEEGQGTPPQTPPPRTAACPPPSRCPPRPARTWRRRPSGQYSHRALVTGAVLSAGWA